MLVYDSDPEDFRYEIGYPVGYIQDDENLQDEDPTEDEEDSDDEDRTYPVPKHYLFNHLKFRILIHADDAFEGSRIVGFEVEPFSVKHKLESEDGGKKMLKTCSPARPVDSTMEPQLTDDKDEIVYTYDVDWKQSDIQWSNRWELYLKSNPDDQIHWFSILNSTLIVFFLTVRNVCFLDCRTASPPSPFVFTIRHLSRTGDGRYDHDAYTSQGHYQVQPTVRKSIDRRRASGRNWVEARARRRIPSSRCGHAAVSTGWNWHSGSLTVMHILPPYH